VNSTNQNPKKLQPRPEISRLKQSIVESAFGSAITGAAAFTVMALTAYILASVLGGSLWFSMILGVTVGALSFCAVRIWLNEDDFAAGDTKAYIVMAGVLSFIGIVLAYITMGMFPLGEHTVLIIDMHHQYVAFFSLLRDTLLGGGNMVYTDSLGLGAGMLPMWAYYVASPFSIITLLFPENMMTEALLLITILKITAAGVTFAIFVKNKFNRNDFSVVIGGVAFSMMSFFIGHSWNLMWLDPIILLPLVALGFERLMKKGRPALYCITLALALATNYYIGYMVCIFMVLYFFAYIISEKNDVSRPALSEKFWGVYRVVLLCIGIICTALLGAYVVMEKFGFGLAAIITASVGAALCLAVSITYIVCSVKLDRAGNRDDMSGGFWKFYRIMLMIMVLLGAAVVIIAVDMEKYVLVLGVAAVMLIAASYFISIRFWRFCYASLIGGGMSAIVILPAFISLMSTSGADDSFSRALASNFSFFELFPRTLFSAAPSMRGDSLPNIYCTVLVLVLFVMYLTCGAIPIRKRIAWGSLVGVIGFSMSLNWLNFAWHGFHFPNDLPYRFSFLMSFAMICVAVQMLDKLHELKTGSVCVSAVILVALILVEQQFGSEADFVMIFVSVAAVVLYSVIIGLHSAGLLRQAVCYALLLVLVFSEAASNATIEMVKLDSKEYYTERNNFVNDYEVNNLAFETIESYKDTPDEMMYREELLPRKTCNDPSLYQYSGMTVFASSNRRSVTTLMGKLGYAVNGVNSYLYKNYVPVSDSILGLKYIALGHSISGHQQLVDAGAVTDSDNIYTRYIYQNSAALSKAFVVSRSIINWNWEDQNPFVVQNSLLNSAVGAQDVYDLIYLQSGGTTYDESLGGYVNEESGTSLSEFNCTVDISGTYFTCSRVSEALTANFTATQTVAEAGQTYAYVDCRAATSITVSAGSTSITVSPTEPYIVDLGYLAEGTDISVTIYTDMSCGGNIFLASLNNDVFDEAITTLQGGMMDVDEYSERKITGTITSSVNGMMFTSIPYDGGWTVKVDGQEVDTFALGDGLLCFAVPSGTHTVSMSYSQMGLLPGIIITMVCLLIFVLLVNRKTREWMAQRVPAGFISADGIDHQFPAVKAPAMPEEDEDRFEGFETVDLTDEPYEAERSAPMYQQEQPRQKHDAVVTEQPVKRQPGAAQQQTRRYAERPAPSQESRSQSGSRSQPQQRRRPVQSQPENRPVMPRGELPEGFESFFQDED